MTTMLYQGHGSYRFTTNDGIVIYVDPFAGEGYDVPADLILVTHEHHDHTQVDKMPHADDCVIIREKDVHPAHGEYLTCEVHGIRVTGLQAENTHHPIDDCVGFLLEMDGLRIYASGDTSMTQQMKDGTLASFKLDYAILCGDGVFNMDAMEASKCAALIGAKHSMLVHTAPVTDFEHPTLFDPVMESKFTAEEKITLAPGKELVL